MNAPATPSETPETAAPAETRARRWARGAGQVALALAIFLGVRAYTQRGIASGPAPALAGHDLAGKQVSLAATGDRPTLVHFWATWCPVCEAESGTITALARDHDVITVAVSSGQADEIRASLAKSGATFPVVVDPEGAMARAWGVHAFPTSFFVSKSRKIRFAETGFTTGPGFRARLWLAGR